MQIKWKRLDWGPVKLFDFFHLVVLSSISVRGVRGVHGVRRPRLQPPLRPVYRVLLDMVSTIHAAFTL